MRSRNKSTTADRALGLQASITRRDFLGSTLLASGGALLGGLSPAQLLEGSDDWAGYGAVGEYRHSSDNPREVMLAGHKMRDKAYPNPELDALDTGELYDCVIIGAGISGLAAALFFQRQTASRTKCLLLDNHPIFGGEAKQNEFQVDGQRLTAHQGSAIYLVPYPYSFIANFYHSIGLHAPKLTYQTWSSNDREMTLGRTPYDSAGLSIGQYGFWFGAKFGQKPGVWLIDPVGKQMQVRHWLRKQEANCTPGSRVRPGPSQNLCGLNLKGTTFRGSLIPLSWNNTTWSNSGLVAKPLELFCHPWKVAVLAWDPTRFRLTTITPRTCFTLAKLAAKRCKCSRAATLQLHG
jgi:hypothetical protein